MLNTRTLNTLEEVRAFVDGTLCVHFEPTSQAERYRWLALTLRQFHYRTLSRADKGLLQRYLAKVAGYASAQIKRLVAQWCTTGQLRDQRGPPEHAFARRYTPEDVMCLVELDRLHSTLSGPATKKLAERAFGVFGDPAYARLATISVAHLYNLRASQGYQRQRGSLTHTQASRHVSIGERRAPAPQGQPGFLRVDSVHQGDFEGIKGVFVINLVDEVTQFQVIVAVERISEHFLLPALRQALDTFPFVLHGFHADNGSEYINHQVAKLLTKLHIELTKSRPRRSTDNALVESKNGSIVRKHLGYAHIPAKLAGAVNDFTLNVLTPYLNFHRPCFFPLSVIDSKGRQRKHYPYKRMNTPFEQLKSLPNFVQFLKPDCTVESLHNQAMLMTDNQAAEQLTLSRQKLFNKVYKTKVA